MKGAIFLFILQGDDGHAKSVFKVISTWEAGRFRGRLGRRVLAPVRADRRFLKNELVERAKSDVCWQFGGP